MNSLRDMAFSLMRESRPKNPIRPGVQHVRASAAAEFCARCEVLFARNPTLDEPDKVETVDGLLTFRHGDALHWVLQNQILPQLGVMLGVWSCLDCSAHYGEVTDPFDPSKLAFKPAVCTAPACSGCCDEFRYREQFFADPDTLLQGHPDGFIKVPWREDVGIFEAKSIGYAKQIAENPLWHHIVQVHVYFLLTGLKWAQILYWHKAGKGLDAWTEHTVEPDEDLLEELVRQTGIMRKGLEGGAVPERVCLTPEDSLAQICPMRGRCFAEGQP